MLLRTHLPISPILNAAVQMTSSRNSGLCRPLILKEISMLTQEGSNMDRQSLTLKYCDIGVTLYWL